MKLNGKSFNGSTIYLATAQHLRSAAGNTSWFTEFTLTRCPLPATLHLFMSELFRHCYVASFRGHSCTFRLGVLNSSKGPTLFVALTDINLINLIFKRGVIPIPTFRINDFKFPLVESLPDDDLFVYEITKDAFCMLFFVFGVDVPTRCVPLCNLDFIHLVWQRFELMSQTICHYSYPF
jgi:hypothetical protein